MANKPQFEMVPSTCIFCAACACVAPGHFLVDPEKESARVISQPQTPDEVAACRAAMINCPTSSIRETLTQVA